MPLPPRAMRGVEDHRADDQQLDRQQHRFLFRQQAGDQRHQHRQRRTREIEHDAAAEHIGIMLREAARPGRGRLQRCDIGDRAAQLGGPISIGLPTRPRGIGIARGAERRPFDPLHADRG
jgi:hypothetical protein